MKLEDLSQNELELKASLYFHICNPLKRWKVEKLVPYKLVLQVVKTLLLVMQVSWYTGTGTLCQIVITNQSNCSLLLHQVVLFTYIAANERAVYMFQSNLLFQELFIRSYVADNARPSNAFLVRTQDQVLAEITYAIERVNIVELQ